MYGTGPTLGTGTAAGVLAVTGLGDPTPMITVAILVLALGALLFLRARKQRRMATN